MMADRIPGNIEPRFFDFWIFDEAVFDWGGPLVIHNAHLYPNESSPEHPTSYPLLRPRKVP